MMNFELTPCKHPAHTDFADSDASLCNTTTDALPFYSALANHNATATWSSAPSPLNQNIAVTVTQLPSTLGAYSASWMTQHIENNYKSQLTNISTSIISNSNLFKGRIYQHVAQSEDDKRVNIACNYCKNMWVYNKEQGKKSNRSTGNITKHIMTQHSFEMHAVDHTSPVTLMSPFSPNITEAKLKLLSCTNMANELICETHENFTLDQMEPFTIVESATF